jgi:two-component system, NarL family, response regulator LiaR
MDNQLIRILICDDQDVVREGLQAILKTAPGMQVIGVARDGAEALALIPQLHPDVVLMDLKMPGITGMQATRQIEEQYPAIRVLVLTTFDAEEWVFDAIRSGAAGYLLKDTPREKLVEAIHDTAAGKTPVDPNVAAKLFAQMARTCPSTIKSTADWRLSEREREILRLLARGLNNSDMAKRLCLSEGTIRNYVSAILQKLDVSDRTQAALLALRYGLVNWLD